MRRGVIMLEQYKLHCQERAEQNVPPLPLSADQTAELIELLKTDHEESELLMELLVQRIPAGVDQAAYVKAGFLSDITEGKTTSPYIDANYAVELLGTMLGGDDVCRGCKRFIHEVINWNSYSNDEKEIVNSRLEEFKVTILSHRFKVTDAELLSSKLKEHAISFNDSLDPITWIFDLLRASSQDLDLELFGLELLPDHQSSSLPTIKDEINTELFELSQAHFDRYFTN